MANFGLGRFPPLPVVVKNIIIINVIVVAIQTVLGMRGIDLGDYMALHYFTSSHFGWWQFFTYMFMHGSPGDFGGTLSHIFFNMFGLYMFGTVLENRWGPKRFLTFYLICGLGAGLCHLGVMGIEIASFNNTFVHYQQHPTLNEFSEILRHNGLSANDLLIKEWSQNPNCSECVTASIQGLHHFATTDLVNNGVVGASGALFGVLFAFGYLFPNVELYIMLIPIPVKAKWAVAGYAAIELFSGLGRFKGDNVAHFAHLGGMLFGFIVLSIWKRSRNNYL